MTINLFHLPSNMGTFACRPAATQRLVLIDAAIASPEVLVAGVLPDTPVEMIQGDRDGIAQISEALQRHPGTASLHLVSHGASGTIYVGDTELSQDTLDHYSSELLSWADWLAPNAELLIYGCEVAKDQRGRAFIARLSELTGASTVATATKTGAAALNGDWNLEAKSSESSTTLAFQAKTMAAYASVLAAGDLDPTFGTGGKVTTDFGGDFAEGRSVILQPDGKIVVAGFTNQTTQGDDDFALLRYNSDGSLDTSFGINGIVTTDFNGYDTANRVMLQSDGKIVVAGQNFNFITDTTFGSDDFALSRYNSDGSLDTSFGINGQVITDVNGSSNSGYGSILQSDGKIVVVGDAYYDGSTTPTSTSDFSLSRYTSDGSLDTSFGTGGIVTTNITTGDLDSSYDVAYSVVQQSDGKIVVVGDATLFSGSYSDFALSRYSSDGSLDTSFGINGIVTTDFKGSDDTGYSVIQQSDGKIVVAGDTYDTSTSQTDFALSRYNSDGSLDTSFGISGIVTTDFNGEDDTATSVTQQRDGKLIVAGTTNDNSGNSDNFALSRYNSDGSLDTSFGTNGKITTDFNNDTDNGYTATLQPDGKIVLVGSAGQFGGDVAIARYDAGLSPTRTKNDFNGDGKTDVVARNRATGETAFAIMDDTVVTQFVFSSLLPDPNWTIDGAGDFDKDGQADVVLRNKATGDNAIELMNGTTPIRAVSLAVLPDLNWGIGGVGDFNRDGNLDLLYRNAVTGENSIALMNGTNLTQTVSVSILSDINWEVGGVGDFNLDGNDDIIFRNKATGENTIALMDGTVLGQLVSPSILPDVSWTIGSVGDYNRDGNVDILYRNQFTGEDSFALMNGTNLSQIVPSLTVADNNWVVGA
jgi:uncharacterized delta-60 repeat protein